MKEFFKKYWVLVIIVCFLIGITGYYTYDTNKGKLPGKTIDGEDVVFGINDEYMTANQLYDELSVNGSTAAVYQLFTQALADQAIETTDEMKSAAKINADNVISQYVTNYGSGAYEATLLSDLKPLGYTSIDDLQTYFIRQAKLNQIVQDYTTANFDDLKVRSVSHILVMMDDPEHPTAEEQEKIDAIDEALASGTAFADVALQYSDDGSAQDGGYLGIIDKNTAYVTSFLDAALALNEGEVSDWVVSEYGYHKIYCDAATAETLNSNYPTWSNDLASNDTSFQFKALWEKAQELGIDFKGNTQLENELLSYMGLTDLMTTDTTSATASPEASAEASASPEASAETSESPEASASAKE